MEPCSRKDKHMYEGADGKADLTKGGKRRLPPLQLTTLGQWPVCCRYKSWIQIKFKGKLKLKSMLLIHS